MKYRRLLWLNGNILRAEDLDEQDKCLSNWVKELNIGSNYYGYGVIECVIDKIKLSDGIFAIKKLRCVLKDRTYIDINESIELDLNDILENFYVGKKIYLSLSSSIKEEIKYLEEIPYTYGFNDLILSLKGDFPIAEINIRGGVFQITDFEPPRLILENNHKYVLESEEVFLFLQKYYMNLKDRMLNSADYVELLFLNNLFTVLGMLKSLLLNIKVQKEIYDCFINIICILGWKNSSGVPQIPIYDHENFNYTFQMLKSLIYEVVSGLREAYRSVDFELVNNNYILDLDSVGKEDLLLIVEPNTEEVKNWILNTLICSESNYDELLLNRNIGIGREIISQNNSLVLKLDINSQYLVIHEKLIINGGGILCIRRMSINLKEI